MKNDMNLMYMEALLYNIEGESPSKAIEDQEAREQKWALREMKLPIKTNESSVPNEYRFNGVLKDMEYNERRKIVDNNNVIYTKEQYTKMGIQVIDEYDDLFYTVRLPEGWEIKPTDHSMWNDVFDDKSRKRMNFFYKGSFYDRDAFVNFCIRYTVSVEPFDKYESDASYEERSIKPWYGVVHDCGVEIFRTTGAVSHDGSISVWDIQESQKKLVLDFINKNYPQWEDINSYWD